MKSHRQNHYSFTLIRLLWFTLLFGILSIKAQISVENLVPGEQLQYPLALLKGACHPNATQITVHEINQPDNRLSFPAVNGKFKALWMLKEGDNTLVLDDGVNDPTTFALKFRPKTSGTWIRPVYLLASDSDGTFDAPAGKPNDTQSAVNRLAVGALLMQTFTAEKMSEAGYGRKTFRLKYGQEGMPQVEAIRTARQAEDYYVAQSNDGDNAFYSMVWNDLANLPERGSSKDIVIASFTRYDGATQTIQGHTALGTGQLGLFGSGTLHTWAESIDQIVERFSDNTRIDTSILFDDSAGRGTFWANYATGLGATLHELGHALSLPHTDQYAQMPNTGIMSRGFDDLNLAFMLQRPGDASVYYNQDGRAFWHPESARILNNFAWIRTPTFGSTTLISHLEANLNADARTYTLSIRSDAQWSVIENADWLSISPISGLGNRTLEITTQENTTGSPRTAMIQIGDQIHTVTQSSTTGFNPEDLFTIIEEDFNKSRLPDDVVILPLSSQLPTISSTGGTHNGVLRLTRLASNLNAGVAWDAVSTEGDILKLQLDFQMSSDAANNQAGGCCGQAADGFGVGFFSASRYGTTGAPHRSLIRGHFEDPAFSPGFPEALFLGLDIFEASKNGVIRFNGPGGTGDPLFSGEAPMLLNDDAFHRLILTLEKDPLSNDTVNASLKLIQHVDTQPLEWLVFEDVQVQGMSLNDPLRVISGARTGAAFAETLIDNVQVLSDKEPVFITNKAPTFIGGSDVQINEDTQAQTIANWATQISPGSPEETQQRLTFNVSVDQPELFSIQPSISASGALSFGLAPNAFGEAQLVAILKDDGGTERGGLDQSEPYSFSIKIAPVNDPPTFSRGPDLSITVEPKSYLFPNWARLISPGPPNESNQQTSFNISSDHPDFFTVPPALNSNGDLSFSLAPGVNGLITLSLHLTDDGGVEQGGINESPHHQVILTTLAINLPPSFTKGFDQIALEDAGPQTVEGWATQIMAGPPFESDQQLSFEVSLDKPELFSTQPTIDTNGNLTYTPAPNATGAANLSVVLRDDGGTENGGMNQSEPADFSIKITPVNDAPSFQLAGTTLRAETNAGIQTTEAWAFNIQSGPTNETHQNLQFNLYTENPDLFAVAPKMTTEGALSFEVVPGMTGTALMEITLFDDGGTEHGGINSSEVKTFNIAIEAKVHPSTFLGGPDQIVLEDAPPQIIKNWASNINPGGEETGATLTFKTSVDRPSLFKTPPQLTPTGDLSYDLNANANGTANVECSLKNAITGLESAPFHFQIQISPVNDAPSFNMVNDHLTAKGNGSMEVYKAWATDILPGPPNEASQGILFTSWVDDPSLFTVPPVMGMDGTLQFATAPNAVGITTATIMLQDLGGTENGGVNISAPRTFQIQIGEAVPPKEVLTKISIRDGHFLLSWNTEPGSHYQVYFSDQIHASTWNSISEKIMATTDEMVFEAPLPDSSRGFYRIQTVESVD